MARISVRELAVRQPEICKRLGDLFEELGATDGEVVFMLGHYYGRMIANAPEHGIPTEEMQAVWDAGFRLAGNPPRTVQ